MRALVVAPDRAGREAARVALTGAGAVVDLVEDGRAALNLFDDRDGYVVDLVLVAATLPGMDVVTTVKGLKRGPAIGAALYVVFDGEPRGLERLVHDAGADGCLHGQRLGVLLPPLVERLEQDSDVPVLAVARPAWALQNDPGQLDGYAVESLNLADLHKLGGGRGDLGNLSDVAEQWFEGQDSDSADSGDTGDDVSVVYPEHGPWVIDADEKDASASVQRDPVALDSGDRREGVRDVLAARMQEPDGPPGPAVEAALRRFIEGQLPVILAAAIQQAQGHGVVGVSAGKALWGVNEVFRQRVLADVREQVQGIIEQSEQQAHAMAASVAHQALSEALPAVHRNMRALLLGMVCLSIAVVAGVLYVAVGL